MTDPDLEERTQVVFVALRELAFDVYRTQRVENRQAFAESLLGLVILVSDLSEQSASLLPDERHDIH